MVKKSKYSVISILMVIGFVALLSFSFVRTDFGVNWTATFYSDENLGAQTCTATGIAGINFNWGADHPTIGSCTATSSDNISIRFTSTQVFNAGSYQFVASSDDGIRVIIDGVTVLDRFIARPLTTDQFTQTMTAGSHTLEVDYKEVAGDAVVQFQWFIVSGGTGGTTGGITPGVPTATAGPTGPQATVVSVKGLAVRTGPYLGASFVTTAVPGTSYPVSGRSHSEGVFNWYLITVGTHTGWSSGRYLSLNVQDVNTIPEVGSQFDQIDGAPDIGVVAAPRAVMNLRLRPSVRSPIIGSIAWGAETSLIGRTVQGGNNFWLQIRWNGQVGWIFAPFVSIRGEINAVPIR